ncbi:MAG: DUF2318 domain-containing protein [Ignavibacteria bacterium]|nr:DUF2318 domain-containing protein [Ignavibacteria bacterium]
MAGQCQRCGTPCEDAVKVCPQCGSAIPTAEPETPTVSNGTPSRKKWISVVVVVVVLALGLTSYLGVLFREYHPVIANQPSIVVPIDYGVSQKTSSTLIEARLEDGSIVIPLKAVTAHKLVRFFDPERVQQVPVLAYTTPEGKIVTAMSISENCRSTDFYLEGHNIHCAACPSYWNMSSLEAYACCQKFYPDPIPSRLVDNEIRINAEVVRSWKSRI